MPLEPIRDLFGEALIASREPTATQHADVFYKPFSKSVFFDRYTGWGLFDSNNRLIENSAYRRGPNLDLVGQSDENKIQIDDCDFLDEDVVYFGPLIPHYGHFVVSSLARAWYFINPSLRQGRRALCHSDHPPALHFASSFMGPLVEGIGLTADDFVSPERPIRIRSVTVPEPAFIEQKEALQEFIRPLHTIGKSLSSGHSFKKSERVAYISKSQVKTGAVVHIDNEVELENELHKAGVDIVYPERMSLADQVFLFRRYKSIIAFVGSALHSHAFVENPPNIIGIALDRYVNSNLVMVDRLNNASAQYIYPVDNLLNSSTEGYGISRSIKDPRALARDLIVAAGLSFKNPSGSLPAPRVAKGNEMSLFSYFLDNIGRPIHKSGHYFFAYERHFAKYVGQPCTFLEIGAGNGGSSQMWKKWLGPLARIVTIDINPVCRQYGDEQVEVRIGSQSDPAFLMSLIEEFGIFDMVLDDGSHHMNDVVASFHFLYERIASNGVYFIEDMHTAYWENYGGGRGLKTTMVEIFKDHLDKLNAEHVRDGSVSADHFTRNTLAMTAYDSILVFERAAYQNKIMRIVGDETMRINY